MTAKDHNRLLGIFFLIHGGLQAFGGIFVALIYSGLGAVMMSNARKSNEQAMGGFFVVMGIVVAVIVLVMAGFSLLAGWKLFKEKSAARTLGIIASCIALLSVPLGTALGIYGLWFFFGEHGKQFYAGGNASNNFQPPPPNNWQ
jgi:hypothetical protein